MSRLRLSPDKIDDGVDAAGDAPPPVAWNVSDFSAGATRIPSGVTQSLVPTALSCHAVHIAESRAQIGECAGGGRIVPLGLDKSDRLARLEQHEVNLPAIDVAEGAQVGGWHKGRFWLRAGALTGAESLVRVFALFDM